MSWSTVKLGDVAEFIRGITFKPVDVVSLDTFNAIGCMRTKNVQTDLDLNDVWGIDKRFVKNAKQIMREGDILVSSANSWNLVGKGCWIPKLNYECTFGGFVSVLRGNPQKIDAKYLYNWYTSKKIQNIVRSFGQKTTNISNLNIERCLAQELVLPPLAEQKRIAAILDKADEIKRKREQAIAKLDQLAQSIFVEMFGHPNAKIKKFNQLKLTDFFKFKTGKLDSNAAVADGKYPFFTCSRDNFCIDDYAFDEEALLLAGNNANADYSVKYYKGKFNAYQRTYVINVIGDNSYSYAKACLEFMLKEFKLASKGSSTKYLTMSIFDRMLIQTPPLALQEQFATRISKLEKLKASNIAALEKHNQLFASLQNQAFTGQL